MVIELQRAIDLQMFVREQQQVTGVVDPERVGLAQSLTRSQQHVARSDGQCSVIEPEAQRSGKLSSQGPSYRVSLKQPHRPLDAFDAAHSVNIRVLQGFGLVEVFCLRVHDPDVGLGDIQDLTAGAPEDAREDRGLVFQSEGAESDREHQPCILVAIARLHFECYYGHATVSCSYYK